jgi:hypothetical protein
MCCSPRGDPFCYNFGLGPEERTPRKSQTSEPKVIVQPVIIQQAQDGSITSSNTGVETDSPRKKQPKNKNKIKTKKRTTNNTKLSNDVV